MSEKEFRIYKAKLSCEIKDDIRNEIREKIQEVKDHFNKEAETLKRSQTEILKMKEQ